MHRDSEKGQVEGPVRSTDILLSNDKHMSFASHGLYRINGVNGKLAVCISQPALYSSKVAGDVIKFYGAANRLDSCCPILSRSEIVMIQCNVVAIKRIKFRFKPQFLRTLFD